MAFLDGEDRQWLKKFQANDPTNGGVAWKVSVVDSDITVTVDDLATITDDSAFTPGTSSVTMIGATFDDVATDSVNEGDGGAVRMSANRNLYTTIRDAAGNERGANVDANSDLRTVAGGITAITSSTVVMSVAGAYATGDYMGTTTTPQSFSGAVRYSGGTGIIKSILISDKIATANVAMELWIIDRTFTAPTDNAAWDLSDANMLFVQAVIPISTAGWYASSAGQVYSDTTLAIPIKPSTGTSIFYALVARGTTPAFTSADLTITLGILQD